MAPPRKRRKMDPVTHGGSSSSPSPLPLVEHAELILKAVREARVECQKQLREQLRQLRQDVERTLKSGQTPLHVFPQEIWEMIFCQLKVSDLASCSRACSSFFRMINSTAQELLFAKVLPLLEPYFHFDNTFPYKECSEVCPKWSAAIQDFAQAKGRTGVPVYTALEALTTVPVPYAEDDDDWIRDVPPEARDNEEEITTMVYELTAINLRLFQDYIGPPPTTLSNLNLWGHRIWRLDLEIRGSCTSRQLYSWCVTALDKCVHLKLLRLHSNDVSSRVVDNGVDHQLELNMGTTLEQLAIDPPVNGIGGVQEELLRRFSGRLKRVCLGDWNVQLYKTFSWANLTEAELLGDTGAPELTSWGQIEFPKLHKLTVRLDSSCDFTLLLKTINKFGSLRHLSLELTSEFGRVDIWKVPMELLTGNQITSLEIKSKKFNQTRDIPVLFPMIRHLKWRHKGIDAAKPDTDFCIQIHKDMYKSNMWNLLPHLQKVILEYKAEFFEGDTKQTFTREEYIWQTQKYSNGIEWQLDRIRKQVKAALRERLRKKRRVLERIAKERSSSPDKSLREIEIARVFPLIIPYLRSSDILACRRVCKAWTRLVGDRHLEDCKQYTLYQFSIPMATHKKIEQFKGFVGQHQGEPFFGWSVEILINKGANCVSSLQTLLNGLGNRIRFLTLSTQVTLEMLDAFRMLNKCLRHCRNLRGLSLNLAALKCSDRIKIRMSPVVQSQRFSKPPDLTWISTFGPENGYLVPLDGLLEELEDSFGGQITVWKQDQSYEGDNIIFFPKLQEWTIRKYETDRKDQGDTYQWGLAESLERLHICITGQQLSLEDFKRISIRYKKLQFLELQFTDAFSGLKESLIHYDLFDRDGENEHFGRFNDDKLQDTDCLHKVTELQLVFKNKYQTSLDFLIHFPHVKVLRIVYGRHANLLHEESSWTPKEYKDKPKFDSLPKRKPDMDFIQLVKYFKDETLAEHNSAEIYASNVWSVLGKLQTLEVVCCAAQEMKDTKVYKRKM